MLGSMGETGNVSTFTLQAVLMAKDVTPVIKSQGQVQSLLPMLAFAYHLDNARLVAYLKKTAIARGVRHLDCKIADAKIAPPAAAEQDPTIEHLVAEDGTKLEFDLYYVENGSLFLDLAIIFHTVWHVLLGRGAR
jgi:hypothetical protein